jgi:hypothetical protein
MLVTDAFALSLRSWSSGEVVHATASRSLSGRLAAAGREAFEATLQLEMMPANFSSVNLEPSRPGGNAVGAGINITRRGPSRDMNNLDISPT